MPVFKVTFERHVSRTVELRQTMERYISAPTEAFARDAAYQLYDELDDYEWFEVPGSRLASNDTVEAGPRPVEFEPARTSAKNANFSATEILGLIGEGEE